MMNKFAIDNVKLESVSEIAKEAGKQVMAVYNTDDFGISFKGDHSPLTRADLLSQQTIIAALNKLTPEIPVLSEESKTIAYNERKDWKVFWLVDPLDGTKEFIKRSGEFTVNIALIENGRPVLGVVYAPALSLSYFAKKGEGAFKEALGKAAVAIKVNTDISKGWKAVLSLSHADEDTLDFVKTLGRFESISMGSSLKFCLVADGSAHIYPRFGPTMEWDTAAAQAVLEIAGGRVCDRAGVPLIYNKESLLNPPFIASAGEY